MIAPQDFIKLVRENKRYIKHFSNVAITCLLTLGLSQIFYKYNLDTQLKLEFEKEIFINQIPLYNRINSLLKDFELNSIELTTITANRTNYIYKDQFENVIDTVVVKDSSSAKKEAIFVIAPNFMFSDTYYDRTINNLNFIKQNKDNLAPSVYMQVDSLFKFLDLHPIPNKDERLSNILAHWSKEGVYKEYHEILKGLNDLFHDNINRYVKVKKTKYKTL